MELIIGLHQLSKAVLVDGSGHGHHTTLEMDRNSFLNKGKIIMKEYDIGEHY